ncbi:MAG: MlaD family protein, partial [Candidatus Omnitrophota bacterium]|nr:MlaD family protein [Candidatus Omnitrophota bacterium]
MEGTRTFELKVGVFILIGIAILFLIVFSIGDINLSKTGYKIKILFGFAAGIGPSAPVRLAGVGVGQVQTIRIIRDEKAKTTKAEITAWINDDASIEKDAVVTINTLGLLGEKYLEIFP